MSLDKVPQQIALTIAGSDPSGGAGIQADLKTFATIGVYGGAVITSLTVQNTQGVIAVQAVAPGFIREQIKYVLNDLHTSHIKIGMLGSGAAGVGICEELADFSGEIIYDPVLVSSSGQQLIDAESYNIIRKRLLSICTVITPNLPELVLLSEQECKSREAVGSAAEKLLDQNQKLRSIIVTGGHFQPEADFVTDWIFTSSGKFRHADCREISHPRIRSRNSHGTGCTFSAAFTAFHLLTGDDYEAFSNAAAYMDLVIGKSAHVTIGHGTGPLLHHLYCK